MKTPVLVQARTVALTVLMLGGQVACWRALESDRAGLFEPRAELSTLLTAVAAWLAQGLLAWVTLLLVLVLLEPATGHELTGWAGCPAGLRRVLLGLCGVAAATALAGPAGAAVADQNAVSPDNGGQSASVASRLSGLSLPDRTDDTTHPSHTAQQGDQLDTHAVRVGESLWRIAEQRLPTGAGAEQIAGATEALYLTNRDTIGADPDLIRPGQQLTIPSHIQEEK